MNRRGVFFSFSSVPTGTAADTFCWRTGILILIMTRHSQKNVFEWESSFWNKILLQWWGWSFFFFLSFERSYCCWYVLSYRYRRLGFHWDWPTGILMMIMTSHSQKNVFEWESSFWNKILLQWWGWIVVGSFFSSRAFLPVLLLIHFVDQPVFW